MLQQRADVQRMTACSPGAFKIPLCCLQAPVDRPCSSDSVLAASVLAAGKASYQAEIQILFDSLEYISSAVIHMQAKIQSTRHPCKEHHAAFAWGSLLSMQPAGFRLANEADAPFHLQKCYLLAI